MSNPTSPTWRSNNQTVCNHHGGNTNRSEKSRGST